MGIKNAISYFNPLSVDSNLKYMVVSWEAAGIGLAYLGRNHRINVVTGAVLLATGLWCTYMDNRKRP